MKSSKSASGAPAGTRPSSEHGHSRERSPASALQAAGDTLGRILLIQSRWMGDVLLCTPAVRAVRRSFPHAYLAFASEAPGIEALRGNPHIDELVVLEKGWIGALRVQWKVSRRRFDAIVDFRSRPSTARLALLSGAPLRVGWRARGPRNLAYTHLVARRTGDPYIVRRKLMLLAPLGVDAAAADTSLEIAVGPSERAYAAALWEAHGLAGERVVALSPMSRTCYKQWGAQRWAAVGDAVAQSGARVLILSGPDEADQVQAVVEQMHRPVVFDCSASNVRQLAALYQRCVLWVGNDGGLRHVAVAAGVPSVTVFRWRQTEFWSDTNPDSGQIGLEEPPPNGCDERCKTCAHLACLGALSPDRVAQVVIDRLERLAHVSRALDSHGSVVDQPPGQAGRRGRETIVKLFLITLATLGIPLLFDPMYNWWVYLLGVLCLVWYVDKEPLSPRQRVRRHAFDTQID